MATVEWEDTISEDCEIEFVDLECDLDAVDNINHSVDYLGIEPYQFEPETSSDCTDIVNNADSVSDNKPTAGTGGRHGRLTGKVSTSRLVQLDYNMQVSLVLIDYI